MVKAVRPSLRLLGTFYGRVMGVRNWLYDHQWLAPIDPGCRVISVGNLTVGGTGKTPVVMSVVKKLKDRGQRVAVVSRGYKRQSSGVLRVEGARPDAAQWYGDEPALLASQLKETAVYVGEDKVRAAREAVASTGAQVVVADDAFQHRRLKRDLDIVVADVTQKPSSLHPMPWGLGREPISGLMRAQLILFTKVNLASPAQVEDWRRAFRPYLRKGAEILEIEYVGERFENLDGDEKAISPSAPLVVMTAIGQPLAFCDLVKSTIGRGVVQEHFFADHHSFTLKDLDRVAKTLPAGAAVLVTEKDAVKLKSIKHALWEHVRVMKLAVRWRKGEETFNNALAGFSL